MSAAPWILTLLAVLGWLYQKGRRLHCEQELITQRLRAEAWRQAAERAMGLWKPDPRHPSSQMPLELRSEWGRALLDEIASLPETENDR